MSGRRLLSFAILAIAWLSLPSVARGQQRPLLTEDPETVNAGLILVEGGIDLQESVFYPVSGLEGDLLRVPVLGMSIGIGSVAEVQVDGGFYNRLGYQLADARAALEPARCRLTTTIQPTSRT